MIAIILAAAALVVAAIALVISMKKQKSIPFTFDKKENMYSIDGNLEVSGTVCCLTSKSN